MVEELLTARIRQAVQERGLDPFESPAETLALIEEILGEYDRGQDRPVSIDPDGTLKRRLFAIFTGYGVLQPLLDDPEVEEIWFNSPQEIFCSRRGQTELTNLVLSGQEVRDLIERMLRASGRHLDYASPFVDAALASGERLHVAIPPITRGQWSVNIRKHLVKTRRLSELVERRMLSAQAAQFLQAAVVAGLNIVISGATQAGKTTLLRALCGSIPANRRVISCEEVFELGLSNRDHVAMQTRGPSLEGSGEITLRRLVIEALRMRPERIIVGEVRGAESLDMLIGLNCGIPGMTTIHANGARQALAKLCTLPLLAGENVTDAFVRPTVASVIDVVVHLHTTPSGQRGVREIVMVPGRWEREGFESITVFRRSGGETGAMEGAAPGSEPSGLHLDAQAQASFGRLEEVFADQFAQGGFDLAQLLAPPGISEVQVALGGEELKAASGEAADAAQVWLEGAENPVEVQVGV